MRKATSTPKTKKGLKVKDLPPDRSKTRRVRGGMSDFGFVKRTDKSSSELFCPSPFEGSRPPQAPDLGGHGGLYRKHRQRNGVMQRGSAHGDGVRGCQKLLNELASRKLRGHQKEASHKEGEVRNSGAIGGHPSQSAEGGPGTDPRQACPTGTRNRSGEQVKRRTSYGNEEDSSLNEAQGRPDQGPEAQEESQGRCSGPDRTEIPAIGGYHRPNP